MIQIQGVYEVAVRVRDLARAEPFYREVLGLEFGLRDDKRKWLFLRVGGSAGMIVLQEDGADGPLQHFAFTVGEAEIKRAAELLRANGVICTGPIVHDWIPVKSLYFTDPDGHDVELCAPLAKPAR